LIVTAEQQNHARAFLSKAEECFASAEDNLDLERFTAAAGDAIHAGISAKDGIFTEVTAAPPRAKITRGLPRNFDWPSRLETQPCPQKRRCVSSLQPKVTSSTALPC